MDILNVFIYYNVIQNGHFVLRSGRHSYQYIEKLKLYMYPELVADISYEMANDAADYFCNKEELAVNAVVGPASGGIILSHLVARYLQDICGREITALFTNKDSNGKHILNKVYAKNLSGKKVLLVDDIMTTGGTIKMLEECVREAGAQVIGAIVICIRKEISLRESFEFPVLYLGKINLKDWDAKECPLCQLNVPINSN